MRNEAPVIVLAEWAARVNAETRACMGVSVAPEIPERQEARAYLAGLMSDQEAAACVAADLARVRALGGRPRDDYEGLSWSFAAACRAADEKRRPYGGPLPRIGGKSTGGLAASTIKAAKYLVRAGDAEQLRHWLDQHSTDERTAIQKHLEAKQ